MVFAAFPRDPEIETSGVLVSGSPVTVSCKVPDVYPLERLEIQLLKGGRVVKNKNFLMGADKKSLETGGLDVTFVPTTEDTGEALVCLAQLHVDELDVEATQRQSSQTLSVHSKCGAPTASQRFLLTFARQQSVDTRLRVRTSVKKKCQIMIILTNTPNTEDNNRPWACDSVRRRRWQGGQGASSAQRGLR